MSAKKNKSVQNIVDTLLAVSQIVIEVSRDFVITNIWKSSDDVIPKFNVTAGQKTTEVSEYAITPQCNDKIKECFATGKSHYLEYIRTSETETNTYSIRILPEHPDNNFLLVTIELLPAREEVATVENKWKLALDSTGDGVWELNGTTGQITFSQKWHEIFGYAPGEVSTAADWTAKLHPDDLKQANQKLEDYLKGGIPSYAAEIRYKCKDGSYKWILSRGVVLSKAKDGKVDRFIGTHTDIDAFKKAEEKYQSAAQLLSKLINNLHSAILVTDENYKVIFANQMFCDLYHISGGPEQLTGIDMHKSIGERKHFYKDPDRFEERIHELLKKKKMILNEELFMADGRIIERDYLPLTLGKNNVGAIWKFRDVTAQKNIEYRFDEQRKFYEEILHGIPADIAVFNEEHTYMFVNRHAFKKEDLRTWMIGKTDIDYARYSNRPDSFYKYRFNLYDDAIHNKRRVESIERMINKQGEEEFHLRLLNPVFLENGKLNFLLAYGLNVTELIKTQNELKTSADTFTSAFEYSGIGIALLNPDGHWMDVNNELCLMTGYSKEELLERTYHDITYPEDDEMDRPLINKLLRKEINTYTIEKRYVSKENKIVLVLLTVSLVWNNDGTPKFFICQVIDITKKKELENALSRRNTELELTRLSLTNKVGQLEELSHIIAHNLRGPAGNIKLLTDTLIAEITGTISETDPLRGTMTVEQGLEFIKESSDALMNSLSTLMTIAQIKLNKHIPYDKCDVSAIVDDISTQQQATIFEKRAQIRKDLEVKIIQYPKPYLESILYNFISNALKYSKTGIPPEITVSTRMDGENILLSVKDNGLGIDLEKHGSRVFKLNQVFHEGFDSKGIGLYITKNQVESLGGHLSVKSKAGEGSEFIVTL
jgi:PAS domain S-box-containing protein